MLWSVQLAEGFEQVCGSETRRTSVSEKTSYGSPQKGIEVLGKEPLLSRSQYSACTCLVALKRKQVCLIVLPIILYVEKRKKTEIQTFRHLFKT